MTNPTHLRIEVSDLRFVARLETIAAPLTCAAFLRVLPFEDRLIQTRWSGEAAWIPMGDRDVGVGVENAIIEPAPGQILFYPKAISETEILFPYGVTRFASKFGPLAGNHFLTLTEGQEQLPELGKRVLYQGAQPIRFTASS